MKLSRKTISGFSLVDIAFATAILAVALAGIYGLFFFGLAMLRTADNSAVANKHLVQRLAQIQRTPSWLSVTSPSYIGTLFSSPIPTTAQNLTGMTQESVTISAAPIPYASPVPSSTPSPTATPTPFTITRAIGTSGTTVSTSSAASLSTAAAINVRLNVQWNDQTGRLHTRELSSILSNAGVTR